MLEKAAYIKGMIDGMDLDESSKEVKLINALSDLVSDLAAEVVALQKDHEDLFELVDTIDQDLGDVEEVVFDCEECDGDCQNCDSECDYDDDEEEEVYETTCPSCGETFYVTEEMLDEGETTCPSCGKEMEIDLDIDDLDD